MQFRLQREQAKKAISYILSVVTDPLILVSANDQSQKVVFEGASTGVYVRVAYDAQVKSPGIVCVNGPHLASYKFHADVDFEFTDGENKLNLSSGSFTGAIALEEGGGFIRAQRAQPTGAPWVTLDRNLLKTAITASVFDPTIKTTMDGVVVALSDAGLSMHVRDAVKAALYRTELPPGSPVNATFVVASKFFEALAKIPGDGPTIDLSVDRGILTVKTDVAGLRYPQLQIEPFDLPTYLVAITSRQPCVGSFQIHKSKLTEAVTTVTSAMRGGADYNKHLDFEVTADSLIVRMQSDHGSGAETILLEGTPQPAKFRISSKHLMELLTHMDGDTQVSVYPQALVFTSHGGKATHLLSTGAT